MVREVAKGKRSRSLSGTKGNCRRFRAFVFPVTVFCFCFLSFLPYTFLLYTFLALMKRSGDARQALCNIFKKVKKLKTSLNTNKALCKKCDFSRIAETMRKSGEEFVAKISSWNFLFQLQHNY